MKFDRNNKFDLCYYGQVNTFEGNIYFAGESTIGSKKNLLPNTKMPA